jgi:hypothetical protein
MYQTTMKGVDFPFLITEDHDLIFVAGSGVAGKNDYGYKQARRAGPCSDAARAPGSQNWDTLA